MKQSRDMRRLSVNPKKPILYLPTMMSNGMCGVHKLAWVLVIIGALNWGLVGLLDFNLVTAIFGGWPVVERIIYVLVGVSAIAALACKSCKACKK